MGKGDIKSEILVGEVSVAVLSRERRDFISLTDLAKYQNPDDPSGVIRNWMSNKNSFEFYGTWEMLNNPEFNSVEFRRIKIEEVPYNRFTMTPKRWRRDFGAIGIIPGAGKYSAGTFAHTDIAFEFASWLSAEFKLYLITEFERLKRDEAYRYAVDWKANRVISKANYLLQTDAIKDMIVPRLSEQKRRFVYASEADVVNVALFGMTAREWKEKNPEFAKKKNMRDFANLLQLIVLSNIEGLNAEMIRMGKSQEERITLLNEAARRQVELFKKNNALGELEMMKGGMGSGMLGDGKTKKN